MTAAIEDDIEITDAIRATLRAEMRRAGVTAIKLLKGRRNLPEKLDARTVNRWLVGLYLTAKRSDLKYVMELLAASPSDPGRITGDGRKLSRRGARHPVEGETWINVTDEMAAHLRGELVRTGIESAGLLRGLESVPPGLTQRVVYGWLYRESDTTNKAHWDYVVARLRSLPDTGKTGRSCSREGEIRQGIGSRACRTQSASGKNRLRRCSLVEKRRRHTDGADAFDDFKLVIGQNDQRRSRSPHLCAGAISRLAVKAQPYGNNAASASFGILAMTLRYADAVASGWRRPCSQPLSVGSGM